MIIGVISDTHIPERGDKLPKQIFEIFNGVDLIIHAGDITSMDVLDKLSRIAEVKAVRGNMDSRETRKKLPEKEILQIGNFSIGIIHGSGHLNYLLDFVRGEFNKNMDVIIFGHSHIPFNEKIGKTLFLNPGSPTDTFCAPYSSCGILKINNSIHAKIVKLNNE